MLLNVLRQIFRPASRTLPRLPAVRDPARRRVLNVGGNNRNTPIPALFDGWEHLILDIDPKVSPDVVCDARLMAQLDGPKFDAIYCSHNLEHYHPHDVRKVLEGFMHVLKDDGFVYINVPDIGALIRMVASEGRDLEDVIYLCSAGPIKVLDVFYGLGRQIEKSGEEFYAHKTGFSESSLRMYLQAAGFSSVQARSEPVLNIRAVAFKSVASADVLAQFQLDDPGSATHTF